MEQFERKMQAELDTLVDVSAEVRRGAALEILVDTLREAFVLRPDEVAILLVSPDGAVLSFAYPVELAAGGSNAFPVALPSLAGRVAVEGVSVCSNRLPEEPHLGFYERVAVRGMQPVPIQKLLAVPLRESGAGILGVIEISRRGETRAEA
ncbi:MAG: hypothetical protein WC713_12150, partial [Candidatus Methylomirabilota bacterium]